MAVYRDENIWLNDKLEAALDELNKTKTDYGPTFDLICDLIPDGDMLLPAAEARLLITGGVSDGTRLPPGWRAHLHSALAGMGFIVPAQVIRNDKDKGDDTIRTYIRGDIGNAKWAKYFDGRIVFEPSYPYDSR
jgi:hypothetical protein